MLTCSSHLFFQQLSAFSAIRVPYRCWAHRYGRISEMDRGHSDGFPPSKARLSPGQARQAGQAGQAGQAWPCPKRPPNIIIKYHHFFQQQIKSQRQAFHTLPLESLESSSILAFLHSPSNFPTSFRKYSKFFQVTHQRSGGTDSCKA